MIAFLKSMEEKQLKNFTVSIGIIVRIDMSMKIMVSLSDEMVEVLEKERKDRYLETIPETIRVILSEHLRKA